MNIGKVILDDTKQMSPNQEIQHRKKSTIRVRRKAGKAMMEQFMVELST